jgi:putative transposase
MKRARFTEEQIIVCCASMRPVRRRRIWRASTASRKRRCTITKFGGMDVSEAKRLRQLEDENAKLKKLLAEQMLDAAALRELLFGLNRIYRLYQEKGLSVRTARHIDVAARTTGDSRSACGACPPTSSAWQVNSVPLSKTIMPGLPRRSISTVSSRATRRPGIEVSGIAARHSRVTSSTMFRIRKRRPLAN